MQNSVKRFKIFGSPLTEKAAIVVACSKKKKKINGPIRASSLYTGPITAGMIKYGRLKGIDVYILSAKYGLIAADEFIDGYYDEKLNTGNVDRVRKLLEVQIRKLDKYRTILLVMGNIYFDLIIPFLRNKIVYRMKSRNGIFDYMKNVSRLIKSDDVSVFTTVKIS